MNVEIIQQVALLDAMTTEELRERYIQLFGEPARWRARWDRSPSASACKRQAMRCIATANLAQASLPSERDQVSFSEWKPKWLPLRGRVRLSMLFEDTPSRMP
jgi:hypothetical protein